MKSLCDVVNSDSSVFNYSQLQRNDKLRSRRIKTGVVLFRALYVCQNFPENPEKSEVFVTGSPEHESVIINIEPCASVTWRY
jgi:hypothetical protein